MFYFSWFIRTIALVLIFEGASWASATYDPDKDESFKKALTSFKEARTTHPKLKTLHANKPTCFISYAWGVTAQEQWVHTLDNHLRQAGVNTILDIRDNPSGTSTIAFVERITKPETDFVVLCGSKKLTEKLKSKDSSVVRLEVEMIGKRATWPSDVKGIIPILLDGKHEEVLPSFLSTTVSIGFQDPARYPQNCFSLLKALYGLEQSDITAITDLANPWELKTKLAYLEARFDTLFNQLQSKIDNLEIENKTLTAKLASKDFKPYFGYFSNINHNDWKPYTDNSWQPVKFNQFSGDDILRGDLTKIIIPEDGLYTLSARYYWFAKDEAAGPHTAIAINQPNNFANHSILHHLAPKYFAHGSIEAIELLKKGDKVMVSIFGSANAQYHLNTFNFIIKRIN